MPKNAVKMLSLNSETAELIYLPVTESQYISTSDTTDDLCQESVFLMTAKLFPKSSGKVKDYCVWYNIFLIKYIFL